MARIAAQLKDRPESKDFAALLSESIKPQTAFEGTVVKGRIVGFTPDDVIIDVGLKSEGRVPMKEFGFAAQKNALKIGDILKCSLNASKTARAKPNCRAKKRNAKKRGANSSVNISKTNASLVSSLAKSKVVSLSI